MQYVLYKTATHGDVDKKCFTGRENQAEEADLVEKS